MKQQNMNLIINQSQHPSQQYSIHQLYTIRKQSIAINNDQTYKKLSRSFQKIKKMKTQAPKMIEAEFNYQSYQPKGQFKRIRQIYNKNSKSHLIHKRKVEKVKGMVQKVNKQFKSSQDYFVKDIDMSKVYNIKPQPQKTKQQTGK